MSEREPTLDEVTNLMFAWKPVCHAKSNAIVLAHKLTMVGIRAGQTSRVSSVLFAVDKAGKRARGSVLASDAVFPFADGVEVAAKTGVTAIIQPGGATRDEEIIRVANHYAIAMIFISDCNYSGPQAFGGLPVCMSNVVMQTPSASQRCSCKLSRSAAGAEKSCRKWT